MDFAAGVSVISLGAMFGLNSYAGAGSGKSANERDSHHSMHRIKTLLLALPGFATLCARLTRGHVRAFMYHRFTDEPSVHPRRMSVAVFRRQMEYLARTCEVGNPDDQVRLESGGNVPAARPLAVVTADDGYADFMTCAFPVLRELGLPATLFVTTGFVDGTIWMWWDRIMWIFEHTDHPRLDYPFHATRLVADLSSPAGCAAAWQQLVPALRFVPDVEKEELVGDLAAVLEVEVPAAAPARYAPATWEQLAGMAAAGITMAGHTRTHPILSQVDAEQARAEIAGSRADLGARLGTEPDWFAYPQGGPADYTPATEQAVRDAGYRDSYVAYYDPALEGRPFARHRYHAVSDWTEFRWVVCGANHLVLKLRRLLGMSTGVSIQYWQGSELAAGPADAGTGSAS